MNIKFTDGSILSVNNIEEFHRDIITGVNNTASTQLIFDIVIDSSITMEHLKNDILKFDNLTNISILDDAGKVMEVFTNTYNHGITINKRYNKDGITFNVQLDTK